MHGLPADFDPGMFVGHELIQVSFTVNTVHLCFDGDIAITMESSFTLRPGPAAETMTQSLPVEWSPIMVLLGRRVHSARATAEGMLVLEFEGGGMLSCLDDSKEYESYHIRIGDREIAV